MYDFAKDAMAPRTQPPAMMKPAVTAMPMVSAPDAPLDVAAVHAAHGDFVWATLQRMGAREADLEDRFQEVFLVVHRQAAGFEGRSRVTTWLYAICLKVMASHRRHPWVRRERVTDEVPEARAESGEGPDARLERRQAQARLREVLDAMDLDRRALFVMAVIEEIPADEIAAITGVPLGTVYSRVHAAKKDFDAAAKRVARRHDHGGER